MMTAEKRADSVIRWLERMKKSYSSGKIETAFMDAECARADFENLRSDVFADIRPTQRLNANPFLTFIRATVLALVIVMAAVMPLSREEIPVNIPAEPATNTIVVMEPHETTFAGPQQSAKPREKNQKKSRPAKTSAPKRQTEEVRVLVKPEETKKTVARDTKKILSLVETGKKALKNKF